MEDLERVLKKMQCSLEIISFSQAMIAGDIQKIKELMENDYRERHDPDRSMQDPG